MNQLAYVIIGLTKSQSLKKYLSYEQVYGESFDDMQRWVPCLKKTGKQLNLSRNTVSNKP
jgi:hypothetical protein